MEVAIGLTGLLGFLVSVMMIVILTITKKPNKKWWAIGILAGFILFIIGVEVTPKTQQTTDSTLANTTKNLATPLINTTTQPVINISAKVLYQTYQNNVQSADATYKGKRLAVTGIFDSVGHSNIDPIPYLVLTEGGPNAVWEVQCEMSSKNTVPLTSLSKGQSITIIGQCDTSYYPGNVFLNDCIILSNTAN